MLKKYWLLILATTLVFIFLIYRYNDRKAHYVIAFKEDNTKKVNKMTAEINIMQVQLKNMSDFAMVTLESIIADTLNGHTSTVSQQVWNMLKNVDSVHSFGILDTLNVKGSVCFSGITGSGGIEALSNMARKEIEMTYHLQGAFCSILNSTNDLVWCYYVSNNNFINMAPWVPFSDYYFQDSIDRKMTYFQYGSPKENPSRKFYFSKPYVSLVKKGVLFDLCKPLYFHDQWLGNFGISFQASKLSRFLMKDELGFETSKYIINKNNNVSGTNGELFFNENSIPNIVDLVDDTLSEIDFFNAPNNTLQSVGPFYYFKNSFNDDFVILSIVKKSRIRNIVLIDIVPEILLSILAILLVLAYEKMGRLMKIKDVYYHDIVAKKDELIEKNQFAALGKIISNVTHEINTPNSAIKATSVEVKEAFLKSYEYLSADPKEIDRHTIKAMIKLKSINSQLASKHASLSTKELRALKRSLVKDLEAISLDELVGQAEYLCKVPVEVRKELFDQLTPQQLKLVVNFAEQDFDIVNGFDRILISSNHITAIIRTLEAYSEPAPMEDYELFDLSQTINHVVSSLNKSKYRNVNFILSIENTESIIKGWPSEIEKVLNILLINAVEASDYKGDIIIGVKEINNQIVLSIHDHGNGILEENIEMIFKPFFTTKSYGEGTGLSLDIARQILLRHRAILEVSSVPGNTVFKIQFTLSTND